ncbi:MAG: PilZ domain-containing protein [Methylobacter sp.]
MEQDLNQSKENRLAGRYPTFCTVELDSGTGITRDLSTMGVCFTTDNEIEPDSMLRCFILMQKMSKNMTRIRCEGRVVRVNKSADGWEVAVNFTTLEW